MSDETPGPVSAAWAHLAQRLVDRHGLDQGEALTAVIRAQLGMTDGPHAQLVATEARAVLDEAHAAVVKRINEAMRAITEAFRLFGEAAARAMQASRDDYVLVPAALPDPADHRPRRPRGRPAWQTPYGPPPRRRR